MATSMSAPARHLGSSGRRRSSKNAPCSSLHMRLCTSGACERDAKSIIVRLSAQVSPATNDMIRASLIDNVTVIPTSAAIEASSMARGCADRPASQWSNGSSAHCASAATVPLSLRRSQYSSRMRLRSSSRSMSSSATASAYRTACVFVSCPISWSPLPVSSTAGARCRRPPPPRRDTINYAVSGRFSGRNPTYVVEGLSGLQIRSSCIRKTLWITSRYDCFI